jgi:hypothetical protein
MMTISMLRCAGLWAGLLAGLAAVELRLLTPEPLRVGQLVEWELVGLSAPEHHDVTRLPALQIATDERELTRPSFTYRPYRSEDRPRHLAPEEFLPTGATVLRVRHAFRQPGAHRLRLVDASGAELWRGQLAVAAAAGPLGPITISDHNPHLLSWADGSPYIPIGCNVAWGTRPDRLATITQHLDALAANGANHVRLWCASWCGQIEGDRPDAYRLDQAWLMDQILAACRARGITALLVLDNHHDLTHGKAFPYGEDVRARADAFVTPELSAQYQRRLRYLIARYGADDTILAWELFNELDLALMDQPFSAELDDPEGRAAAWVDAAAGFIQAHAPDRRLVTVSLSSRAWTQVFAQPSIDLVQVHCYIPSFGLTSPLHHDAVVLLDEAIAPFAQLGKPFAASEVGHHGSEEDNPGNQADSQGVVLRQQAWAGLLLGGYGSGMNWWWDVYLEPNELWSVYAPLAEVVAALDWTDNGLHPLRPNRGSSLRILGWRSRDQALLWPQIRQDTWHAQAVGGQRSHFGERGPVIRVGGLERESTFTVRAFDMLAGGVVWTRALTSDAEGDLRVPLAGDCGRQVLVIRRLD